jgi:aminomethyltransferase
MKKTRFNELHKKLGGKMIEFCGWELPVEYSGIIPEHIAVRTKAGLFDVSHMGEVLITGKDALAYVQWLTPNDAARLVPGQVQYTALMTPESTFVDDMLVYCMGQEATLRASQSRSRTRAMPTRSWPSRGPWPRRSSSP